MNLLFYMTYSGTSIIVILITLLVILSSVLRINLTGKIPK